MGQSRLLAALGVLGRAPLVCGIAAVAPFLPLLIPDGRIIPPHEYCDYLSYQLPVREFARGEWLSGRFPLWIPSIGCGMPLHAGMQAALAHPLLTPFVILFGANYGIKLGLFLHLLLAYAGEYLLARTLGISRAAASFAGIVTAQCGFAVAHLMEGHVTLVLAYGLIPWFFLALIHVMRRPGPGTAVAMAAAVGGFVLTGYPQLTYYTLLFGACWALGSLVCGAAALRRKSFLLWTGGAAGVAVLLGSIQLIPTLELLEDGMAASQRGASDYAARYALEPLDLLGGLIPNFRGNPLVGLPEFPRPRFFHEKMFYFGIATPILVLFGMTREGFRRSESGLVAMSLAGLLIALGHSTPCFEFVGQHLPGLFLFRCPGRVFGVLSVFVPLLAARGLDGLVAGERRVSGRRFAVVGVFLWLAANAFASLILGDAETFPWQSYWSSAGDGLRGEWLVSGILLVDTLLALALAARVGKERPRLAHAVVVGVVLLDLWCTNARSVHLVPEPQRDMPAEVLAARPPIRFTTGSSRDELRYSDMVPIAIRHRRSTIATNEGGIVPAALERLHRAAARRGMPVAAVAACRYRCRRPDGAWQPVPNALPRIRFLPASHRDVACIPIERVRPERYPSTGFSRRRIETNPRVMTLDVNAPQAGLLVVADTWYPGWDCRVDGRPARIRKVHGVFRGVALTEGRHRVRFSYRPASFRWGLVGTALGLVGVVALGALHLLQRERYDG